MTLRDDDLQGDEKRPEGTWRGELDAEGFTLQSTPPLAGEVTDWDHILRHFGLDPREFTVVDDTVRMSSWQQSKRTDDGDRDVVWLYAYSARFRRVTNALPAMDVDGIRSQVLKWKPIRRTPGAGLGAPSTYLHNAADWQLGKSASGGTPATTQAVLDSFEKSVHRVKELRRLGRNVTSGALWNMGDPTEGCYGQYDSQLFTTDMTRRDQLGLAITLFAAGVRALAPLFDDFEFGSVLCNHGEWTRLKTGGGAITSDSDNASGFIADTVQTILDDRPGLEHVRWSIPHDEMTMLTDMSGLSVALTHGHKDPGGVKEREWLQAQSLRMLREHGREPRLWVTAHRHHLEAKDYGPWHRLQCPSLDGGSKFYTDAVGMWATPGTLTVLVGQHPEAGAVGFSDLAVLRSR